MDDNTLRATLWEAFQAETAERLHAMATALVALEKAEDAVERRAILEALFREAHSLKGAARAVNHRDIEKLCQALESAWKPVMSGEMDLSRAHADLYHDAVTLLEEALADHDTSRPAGWTRRMQALVDKLTLSAQAAAPETAQAVAAVTGTPEAAVTGTPEAAVTGTPEAAQPPSAPPREDDRHERPKKTLAPPGVDHARSVRISVERLDALVHHAEEVVSLRPMFQERFRRVAELLRQVQQCQKAWLEIDGTLRAMKPGQEQDGDQRNSAGGCPRRDETIELIRRGWVRAHDMERELLALGKALTEDSRQFARVSDELLEHARRAALLPVSTVFASLPRMARELARSRGKQVNVVLSGEALEVDRRVLDAMKDAFVHLVRNAVDHGLEDPDTRERQGKPGTGTVRIDATQPDGDKIRFVVADDGKGLDAERLRRQAVKLGLVSEEAAQQMSDAATWELAFRPELSTSERVTEISGRGFGLDIVLQRVEALGGIVHVTSAPGRGTTFTLDVPVSVSTFRGILVSVSGRRFVLPSAMVERAGRVGRADIRTSGGRRSFVCDDRLLPAVFLGDILGIPRPPLEREGARFVPFIVLGTGNDRIALEVSEVIGAQEVVVKHLGPQLARIPCIFGATVLGGGEIVPILRVSDLLKGARSSTRPSPPHSGQPNVVTKKKVSILVVDDSITSRTLLRNILELAGYEVETAVDGAGAWETLQRGRFDLVVSDVEMPHMDGFTLTRRIRSDPALGTLPVVLVTGRDTGEDRAEGLEAGASAYVVKRRFDQGTLLDVVRKLV